MCVLCDWCVSVYVVMRKEIQSNGVNAELCAEEIQSFGGKYESPDFFKKSTSFGLLSSTSLFYAFASHQWHRMPALVLC